MQPEPIVPVVPVRKGFAIASLVFGLVSLPTCGILGIGSLAGIVLGSVALYKISQQPQVYGGKGMAVGGIITSVLAIFIGGIGAAVALPRLQETLKLGREAVAKTMLTKIHTAEAQYNAQHGKFGTLQELAAAGLIDKALASGQPLGDYVYTESEVTADTYCVHATRASDAVAHRDFNVSEDGDIHFVESKTRAVLPRGDGVSLSK